MQSLLQYASSFEWIQECQEALQRLKEYFSSFPFLKKPSPRETLYLYMDVLETIVNSVLALVE